MKNVLLMISPYSQPRLAGIARCARECGWNLMMSDRLGEKESPGDFDGVLMTLRDRAALVRTAERLIASGTPTVDLTVERLDIPFPRVVADHKMIGRLAAEHFIERNFSHFAWYSSGWSTVHELRYSGFADALPKGCRVHKIATSLLDKGLTALPRPFAVLAYNDVDAARLVWAAQRQGLAVPQDLAVLGIGNDPFLCENQVTQISSIDQRLEEGAYEGARLLNQLMTRKRPRKRPTVRLIPPGKVVPRASSDTLAHTDPLVRAVLVYIHTHLSRSFGITEIARDLGVSRTKLNEAFTASAQRTIGAEILHQRMVRAKNLLQDRSVPIERIADVCGFCNAAYFSNTFKRETGLSPKQWSRQ